VSLKSWLFGKAITGKLPAWIYKMAWNKITRKKGAEMLGNIKEKVSGYKTYITVALGLLIATAGVLFGPIDLPGNVDIPAMTPTEYFQFIWANVVAVFLRMGVKKSGPEINKA
jgi:hypothetical protein